MRFFMLVILTALSLFSCAISSNEMSLIGAWKYRGQPNQSASVECPDVLYLESDGSYSVLNDCYSANPVNSVTETGNWSYDSNSQKLSLKDRIHLTNYNFINNSNFLNVKVIQISINVIDIYINSDTSKIEEYERINPLPIHD